MIRIVSTTPFTLITLITPIIPPPPTPLPLYPHCPATPITPILLLPLYSHYYIPLVMRNGKACFSGFFATLVSLSFKFTLWVHQLLLYLFPKFQPYMSRIHGENSKSILCTHVCLRQTLLIFRCYSFISFTPKFTK